MQHAIRSGRRSTGNYRHSAGETCLGDGRDHFQDVTRSPVRHALYRAPKIDLRSRKPQKRDRETQGRLRRDGNKSRLLRPPIPRF